MSAIPNLPEHLIRPQPDNKDAAHIHFFGMKDVMDVQIDHIENVSEAGLPATYNATGNRTKPSWQLHDAPVENQRPLRVIVIGAGYSGVYCGIRIPERLRNCDLTIYEKNDGIGGTWYENRYPGAACDIPSHSYQFSFNPKHDWSSLYAPSKEIREYIQDTAKKYGADRFIKLKHEIKACTWDQEKGKWLVAVQRPDGEVFEDSCDVLISARGLLNNKQWPQIDGFEKFEGEVMHSAAWNEAYDFTNKRIGVIGSGSSAIQIIPKLQQVAGTHLDCFIRSRTWISPPFGHELAKDLGVSEGLQFLPGQIDRFAKDPQHWFEFRMRIEADANNIHATTLKGSKEQRAAQTAFDEGMRSRLQNKKEYYDWLKPNFAPGCRRLTPGPGFLEALVQDNVSFVRDRISRVTATGIVTEDGAHHELDVLVCATGFHASAAPPFPVTGQDGTTMAEHWHDRATNYLSLATDRFPNHFFMLGPNGAIGEGSLTMMIESTGDYITKAIRKLQKENIRSMVVKPARVRDFTRYCDCYFEGTVYMDDCKSWYRKNGQGVPSAHVTGLWPGSTLHCIEALRSPRWEDYEYEYQHEHEHGAEANALAWLGNGWAANQLRDRPSAEELAWYLMPMFQEETREGRPEESVRFALRPWSY